MIQREKKLLAEKELVIEGDLYRGLVYLGKFDLDLAVRKSILRVKGKGRNGEGEDKDCLILTMMGSLFTNGQELSLRDNKTSKDSLTLHLSDDYFFPITLLPTRDREEFQVLGCVVTKATDTSSPYL